MIFSRLPLALAFGLITSLGAHADILNKPVSLKTEGDLVQAVSTTLQHASPRLNSTAARNLICSVSPATKSTRGANPSNNSTSSAAFAPSMSSN